MSSGAIFFCGGGGQDCWREQFEGCRGWLPAGYLEAAGCRDPRAPHRSICSQLVSFPFQVTKAGMMVTAIFIATFSYNLWYFFLGTFGVFKFQALNFQQALSMWVTSFNCFVNPFVYYFLMPAFKRSVRRTFCFCCCEENGEYSQNDPKSISERSMSVTDTTRA